MPHDQSKMDDAVLALLAALSFDEGRAWKGFDFDVMNRLFEQGLIENPRGKAKSVCLTAEGLRRGQELADRLFGQDFRVALFGTLRHGAAHLQQADP